MPQDVLHREDELRNFLPSSNDWSFANVPQVQCKQLALDAPPVKENLDHAHPRLPLARVCSKRDLNNLLDPTERTLKVFRQRTDNWTKQ
jgi:hypothetical protein